MTLLANPGTRKSEAKEEIEGRIGGINREPKQER